MCKLCWSSLLIACLAVGAMAYKFIIAGETLTAEDGRQQLLLEPGERDLVLTEMRMFLTSVQEIIHAANENDAEKIVKAARTVGRAAQQAVPGSLMKKLPLEFKQLGFDTHAKFDQIALDAEQFGDTAVSLKQLATLMQNCVGCHAGYRIDAIQFSK
ncbi:MAG: hypothetical protein OQK72_04195 [Gammaproteobacteria bacterium]|nr:hypothetical protein [Gammaproteobacteria bacterium]MCW9003684.1 hypothetical protein [Gammaproteobacteria bacterium]